MNKEDRYTKLVVWSDEDNCFIGNCPGPGKELRPFLNSLPPTGIEPVT